MLPMAGFHAGFDPTPHRDHTSMPENSAPSVRDASALPQGAAPHSMLRNIIRYIAANRFSCSAPTEA